MCASVPMHPAGASHHQTSHTLLLAISPIGHHHRGHPWPPRLLVSLSAATSSPTFYCVFLSLLLVATVRRGVVALRVAIGDLRGCHRHLLVPVLIILLCVFPALGGIPLEALAWPPRYLRDPHWRGCSTCWHSPYFAAKLTVDRGVVCLLMD